MPFDPRWPAVSLDDISGFLADAEDEGLTWEAKSDGTERLRPASVAKAVCGFANSEYGGYLVLGAARENEWLLNGLEPREPDLTTWVTNAISNGVRPLPRWETLPFALDSGRIAGLVRVWPGSDGLRLTGSGIPYLRVSGATIPITDPAAIERLVLRGEAARSRAEGTARQAANSAVPGRIPTERALGLRVALAPMGLSEDIAASIFRKSYANLLFDLLMREVPPEMEGRFVSRDGSIGQDFISQWAVSGFTSHPASWAVARWDGSVTVGTAGRDAGDAAHWYPPQQVSVERLVTVASEAVTGTGGYGMAHLAIRAHEDYLVARWVDLREPLAQMASIMREFERIAGEGGWEPEE